MNKQRRCVGARGRWWWWWWRSWREGRGGDNENTFFWSGGDDDVSTGRRWTAARIAGSIHAFSPPRQPPIIHVELLLLLRCCFFRGATALLTLRLCRSCPYIRLLRACTVCPAVTDTLSTADNRPPPRVYIYTHTSNLQIYISLSLSYVIYVYILVLHCRNNDDGVEREGGG